MAGRHSLVLALQLGHLLLHLVVLLGAELHPLLQVVHVHLLALATVHGRDLIADLAPHRLQGPLLFLRSNGEENERTADSQSSEGYQRGPSGSLRFTEIGFEKSGENHLRSKS